MTHRNTLAGIMAVSIFTSATQPLWAGGKQQSKYQVRYAASCPNGRCPNQATYYQPQYYLSVQAVQPVQYVTQEPAKPAQNPVSDSQIVQASYSQTQTQTQSQTQPPSAATTQSSGDPYGFGKWLNNYRASAGLPPLAYDPNLSAWAALSNAAVRSYGWGQHWDMRGTTYQNLGSGDAGRVWAMWTASPAHRVALLGNATYYGIAFDGQYWTYNAK